LLFWQESQQRLAYPGAVAGQPLTYLGNHAHRLGAVPLVDVDSFSLIHDHQVDGLAVLLDQAL